MGYLKHSPCPLEVCILHFKHTASGTKQKRIFITFLKFLGNKLLINEINQLIINT